MPRLILPIQQVIIIPVSLSFRYQNKFGILFNLEHPKIIIQFLNLDGSGYFKNTEGKDN